MSLFLLHWVLIVDTVVHRRRALPDNLSVFDFWFWFPQPSSTIRSIAHRCFRHQPPLAAWRACDCVEVLHSRLYSLSLGYDPELEIERSSRCRNNHHRAHVSTYQSPAFLRWQPVHVRYFLARETIEGNADVHRKQGPYFRCSKGQMIEHMKLRQRCIVGFRTQMV